LVEFLAYSGLRTNSEAIWVRWEDIDWQQKMMILRGHPETGTKNSEIRRVPIIPAMENLLWRMKDRLGTEQLGGYFKRKSASIICHALLRPLGFLIHPTTTYAIYS